MLLIMGSVRAPVDAVESARPAMRAMLEATRAEPGCLRYAFAEDVLDPGLIHISEAWQDQESLSAHAASAHMAVWRTASAAFGIGERNLMLYPTEGGRPL